MAATGLLLPNIQLSDNNGDPVSGGKLYAYTAGTSTPQSTYTSSSLGTPNANPVILDSAGRAVVYLSPTPAYKFILKDSSDVQIWSQDNVSPAAVAT